MRRHAHTLARRSRAHSHSAAEPGSVDCGGLCERSQLSTRSSSPSETARWPQNPTNIAGNTVSQTFPSQFVLKEQAAIDARRNDTSGMMNPMDLLSGPTLDTFVEAMQTGGDPLGEDVFEHGLRMIISGAERDLAPTFETEPQPTSSTPIPAPVAPR